MTDLSLTRRRTIPARPEQVSNAWHDPAIMTKFMSLRPDMHLARTFFLASGIGATATINAPMTAILVILALAILKTAGSLISLMSARAAQIDGGFFIAMGVVMILCQGIFWGHATRRP